MPDLSGWYPFAVAALVCAVWLVALHLTGGGDD